MGNTVEKVRVNSIPQELKDYPNWTLWRIEPPEKEGAKPRKVPYQVNGKEAKSNDPNTWTTFDAVVKAMDTGKYDGVGFQFGNSPFCGYDHDNCVIDGAVTPEAYEVIQKLNSYTELSQSGTGIHIIIEASKIGEKCKNTSTGQEMYDTGRGFWITGKRVEGTPATVEKRQAECESLYRKMFPKKESPQQQIRKASQLQLSDSEIIDKALKAKNGDDFRRLYNGDISGNNNDHSSADLAFCDTLAFYTKDFDTIDRIFKSSGLYRDKWDRQDYKTRTIQKAIADCTGNYGESQNSYKFSNSSESIAEEPPDFDNGLEHLVNAENYKSLTANLSENGFINPLNNLERYSMNDIGNGFLFADNFIKSSRYVAEQREWFCYEGKVWKQDSGELKVSYQAKELVRHMIQCGATIKKDEFMNRYVDFAKTLNKRKNRETMLKDARDVAPISISDFDYNKYWLNCQNGVLNLKTFEFMEHNPDLLLSKISNVNYDPDAKCERWEKFVSEIMEDDQEKAMFLQKALGYALTGDTSIECFFILYGATTRNGKGTTMDTIHYMLGDYARTAQPETLAQKTTTKGNEATEDIARLKGARFINISEPEKGLKLNGALVKQLTGGDIVTARFLHKNSFEYKPEYKIFINTNHLPKVSDNSLFTSGRIKLIPFERHFNPEEQDKGLKDFFKEPFNLSGILNWCLEGLKLLYKEGLESPKSVEEATDEYKDDSDIIQNFIFEHLEEKKSAETLTMDIYPVYCKWADKNGFSPMSHKTLVPELRSRLKNKRKNMGYVILDYIIKLEKKEKEELPKELQQQWNL
jgi:putative DNA primase/helicase